MRAASARRRAARSTAKRSSNAAVSVAKAARLSSPAASMMAAASAAKLVDIPLEELSAKSRFARTDTTDKPELIPQTDEKLANLPDFGTNKWTGSKGNLNFGL